MSKTGMKLAVVSEEKADAIIKLADAIDNLSPLCADDESKEDIIKAARGLGRSLRHIVLAYETIFNHCCDPKAETLEFKSELVAFTDILESNPNNGVRLIAEERAKPLKKKGDAEGHDWQYGKEQLIEVATDILKREDDMWGLFIKHPDRIEQLKIAGALCAAEIDRLQYEANKLEGGK